MSDALKDFLQEAFWFLVPLLGGYLFSILRHSTRVSCYKRLMRLSDEEPDGGKPWLKFITANPMLQDEEELVSCGYVFEYRAAGELGATLNKLYGPDLKISTAMSTENFNYTYGDLDCNLVIIGGPFHNCVTREFLRRMGDSWPFFFEGDATLVYAPEHDKPLKRYTPRDVDGKYYGEDYALVMNVKNPYDPTKRAIFIAGCRSIGCYGGAIFLSQQLKEIRKSAPWDEYALVIACSGDAEDLNSRPKLVDCFPLDITYIA